MRMIYANFRVEIGDLVVIVIDIGSTVRGFKPDRG